MNCKKCGALIDKESNFCPYCGEANSKQSEKKEYDDPFKNLRMDNTHQEQHQYQQKYSNEPNKIQYKDDYEEKKPITKDNKSLIGLILGIISVPLCFINGFLGIPVALIAIILVIVGFKHTSKTLAIISLIVSIISFVITLLIGIFMLVGSIILPFQNGYETSIKQYFIDAFNCGFNSSRVEGYWINSSDELLYLDDEGNYYIYLNKDELTDNGCIIFSVCNA